MYLILYNGEVIDLVRTLKEAKEYGCEYRKMTEAEEDYYFKEKYASDEENDRR